MRLFFYFVPMSMLLLHCLFATGVKNITTDQSALLAFKIHVSDPRSILAKNWSTSYPVCSWVGITCGVRHHRVIEFYPSDMGLGGTISPHLGNLSFLIYLNISHNNFHGHLPNELGQLRRLKYVSFRNNELSGNIPSWIGSLSKLRTLILPNNSFTGSIPDSLFNLSWLQNLDVMYNMIDGSIPSRIGNLSKLMNLNFGYNNLQGEIPREIGNLQILKYLVLGPNNLSGSIPPSIFNISTITIINLFGNQLTGHLASTLGQSLPNLMSLILAQNKLIGTIPKSITNASNLQVLELSYNSFYGHIPNTFGNLRHLRMLHLRSNNLTTESSSNAKWSFLSSLTSCRNLTSLNLGSNPLGGTLPPLIGNFSSSLQYFYAFECQLKGNIPQEIENLQGMILLSLYSNDLNGTIPTVGRLQQLQGLALADNHLQGSIPYNLCQLKRLNVLFLQGNKLKGSIPTCLASLISLRELDLNSNRLSYNIPSALWNLEYILHINLSSNSLIGSLTSDIQNMKVLIELDLSRNQLSGDIPKAIGGLKDLVTLSLAGNQFQGLIPESFGNLISLESLDLSTNNLSGGIPKSLVALSHLKQFNVSHNRLEGEIPTDGPFGNFSAQSFRWNYALCGPPRLQVPPCNEDKTKGFKKVALIVLKYIFPPIVCIVLIALVFIFFLRRRSRSTKGPDDDEELLALASWRRTSYLDLQRATDGFNECNLLGSGSFGSIYKGILSDGTNVAVKVFNLQLEQAFRSFDAECEVLRNVRHRNLIKILSSCCNPDFKALVLEFMPNSSLEKWLYSHNYFLDISDRLNIMIDVALALEYLHHGHSTPVIHCDLKPSNILLDENMVAHVSDFGISKLLGEGDDSVIQTMTMATIGYMAPEFGSEGIISIKCDVYSYGILLLETFTRTKPTDEMFAGEMNLKNWVKVTLPHGLLKVADANLLQEGESLTARMDCLLSIFHLALDCCMESPDQRIYMKDAAANLKKIREKFLEDAKT